MRRLGQHFLVNKEAIKTIVAALALRGSETVVEIGAGHGELTEAIGERCQVLGAKVIAVEKDLRLFHFLKEKFKGCGNVEVIHGDILKLLPPPTQNLKAKTYKVIGNIPFYLTGRLLRIVGELPRKPKRIVLTIQKEVAERIVAVPPKVNRLAASVQFWAKPKILGVIPKADFRPPPEVDAAILLLLPHPPATREEREDYYRTVRLLFAQPRKTIVNNLLRAAPKGEAEKRRGTLLRTLQTLHLSPEARPQNLGIEEIKALSRLT